MFSGEIKQLFHTLILQAFCFVLFYKHEHGIDMVVTIASEGKVICDRVFLLQGPYVAAIGSSNLGDVSPNIKGPHCVNTGESCENLHNYCPIGGVSNECRKDFVPTTTGLRYLPLQAANRPCSLIHHNHLHKSRGVHSAMPNIKNPQILPYRQWGPNVADDILLASVLFSQYPCEVDV